MQMDDVLAQISSHVYSRQTSNRTPIPVGWEALDGGRCVRALELKKT